MCPRLSVLLLWLFLASPGLAQQPASRDNVPPSRPGRAHADGIEFTIENPRRLRFPAALAERILRDTTHAFAVRLNPGHPPSLLGHVTLRLGEPGFTLETLEGKERRTVITMREWDEAIFARMCARAARASLLADPELDQCAREGLAKARSVVNVTELQQAR